MCGETNKIDYQQMGYEAYFHSGKSCDYQSAPLEEQENWRNGWNSAKFDDEHDFYDPTPDDYLEVLDKLERAESEPIVEREFKSIVVMYNSSPDKHVWEIGLETEFIVDTDKFSYVNFATIDIIGESITIGGAIGKAMELAAARDMNLYISPEVSKQASHKFASDETIAVHN